MVISSKLGVFGLKENFGVPDGVPPTPFPIPGPNDVLKDLLFGVDRGVDGAGGTSLVVCDLRSGSPFTQDIDSNDG